MNLVKFTSYSTGKPVYINYTRVAAVQESKPTEDTFTVIKIDGNFAYHVTEKIDTVINKLEGQSR